MLEMLLRSVRCARASCRPGLGELVPMSPQRNRRAALAAGLVAMSASVAMAQVDVEITSPLTIGPLDTTITPPGGGGPIPLSTVRLTVRGTTVTIDGSHTLAGLTLIRNGTNPGIVTHSQGQSFPYPSGLVNGVDLTVNGNVFIESAAGVTSRIDANGKGLMGGQGTGAGGQGNGLSGGGAGYGGAGADAEGSRHAFPQIEGFGGRCFGFSQNEVFGPNELGSGGGNTYSGGNPTPGTGGTGGGAVRLNITGSFILNGQVTANGLNGAAYAGGGSGGSIDIRCGSLTGSGSVTATGGAGGTGCCAGAGGGGGGGRIAVRFTSTSFGDAQLGSYGGGNGVRRGGAGTVYAKADASPTGALIIDNNNSAGEATELYGDVALATNLTVRNQGALGAPHSHNGPATDANGRLNLTLNGNLTVESGGYISADGRGLFGSAGSGAGGQGNGLSGGGAGYGGAGADAEGSRHAFPQIDGLGGKCYNFDQSGIAAPGELGSGGGNTYAGGSPTPATGGAGGGSIRLNILGSLTVDGQISASGFGGAAYAGGGSGGSIHITCVTLAGNGVIIARGGPGGTGCCAPDGGGGGGGRIAIHYTSSTMSDTRFGAFGGGTGARRGGAGTVYTKSAASPLGTLIIDNESSVGEVTEIYGPVSLSANLRVRNLGVLGAPHSHNIPDADANGMLNLTLTGDATVEASGYIGAGGRGLFGSAGSGAGGQGNGLSGGGAGYGGTGGRSGTQTLGGGTYGDAAANLIDPGMLGSGGGNSFSSGNPVAGTGGAGGGRILLRVSGLLTVNGQITANGFGGAAYSGGGSGGSILIYCGGLAGTGVINASGGPGGSGCCAPTGGGGAGGRVAIHSCASVPFFPTSPSVNVNGGTGFQNGFQGTTWFGPVCPADYDCSGAIEPADVARFVAEWFSSLQQQTLVGDFDANRAVQPADVSLFVTTWFNALATGC